MLDAVIIAAIREEYNRLTPDEKQAYVSLWHFAAAFLCDAFHDNDDDAFFEWTHSLVDKHATAILIHNPELSKDDDLMDIYFDDFDFEA